jgi:FolB domain-containing protein
MAQPQSANAYEFAAFREGTSMTRLLVSVGTLEEADIALAGGADILDLRPTAHDASGAPRLDMIRTAVAAFGHRRSVSAAAGTLSVRPDVAAAAVLEIAASGVDYVIMALPPGREASACVATLAGQVPHAKIIAVFFADMSPDLSLLPQLARSGFVGAMIDTRAEASRPLLDYFDMPALRAFVETCHSVGLLAGLAGALELPDIPRLLVLEPDLLGFRGVLKATDGKVAGLDLAQMHAVRGLIPQKQDTLGQRDVDYRLLAPRGYPAAVGEDLPVDLVFVEDLVLPVFIGAYARERETPQNVRFAVTASVTRTGRAAEDMRDIFSYDLITDGIRLLIGSGHVALVETLAERVAAMVLNHPRVTKAVVRIQKLDTGSGVVGVEIERTRSALSAIDRPVHPRLVEAQKGTSGAGSKP